MTGSNKLEKTALFIDGANLYATAKSLGFDIDYKRLLREFQSRGYLLRAFYYTAVIEDQEYSSIRPLIDWLDYNGYTVVTKATKEFVDQTGRRKVKGNMDIELAVDAMELAGSIDHMVLFSGDGDFRSLIEAVQRRGVRVTVVSTMTSQPPMVADELRRQADEFIDIVQLAKQDRPRPDRTPGARAARRRPRTTPAHSAIFAAAGRATCQCRPRWRRFRRLRIRGSPRPAPPSFATAAKPGRDCPLCPRLAAFREDVPTARTGLVQRAGRLVRSEISRSPDRRACARAAGREPHRPTLHRRLCRRPAVSDADRVWFRTRAIRSAAWTTAWS